MATSKSFCYGAHYISCISAIGLFGCKLRCPPYPEPAGSLAAEFFDLLAEQAAADGVAAHLLRRGFLADLAAQLVAQTDLLLAAQYAEPAGAMGSPLSDHPLAAVLGISSAAVSERSAGGTQRSRGGESRHVHGGTLTEVSIGRCWSVCVVSTAQNLHSCVALRFSAVREVPEGVPRLTEQTSLTQMGFAALRLTQLLTAIVGADGAAAPLPDEVLPSLMLASAGLASLTAGRDASVSAPVLLVCQLH